MDVDIESVSYVGPIVEEYLASDGRMTGQSKKVFSFVVKDAFGSHVIWYERHDLAFLARQKIVLSILER